MIPTPDDKTVSESALQLLQTTIESSACFHAILKTIGTQLPEWLQKELATQLLKNENAYLSSLPSAKGPMDVTQFLISKNLTPYYTKIHLSIGETTGRA
jgi:hypothetical protein